MDREQYQEKLIEHQFNKIIIVLRDLLWGHAGQVCNGQTFFSNQQKVKYRYCLVQTVQLLRKSLVRVKYPIASDELL